MARKTTDADNGKSALETADAAVEQPDTSDEITPQKDERNTSGFYCYIGPNLNGLIQTGTIYRGTRKDALAKAEKAIKADSLVKTLIVSGDSLPEARLKVKTPGNALHASYQKLAGKEGK
ncbi:hypothetical protein D1159_00155 [Pseudoflavonifractor sp. 524-17]|uniref:hypothetical protein n=1 Tax=Pseudoflavonifractor sp. 524-17 TaxID=2304577 RepID=UPI00137B69A8|nr:hypothetical protein [Pseudoflavonifractor sp. 524-17]NCE63024.1 hypothetical protein [Pseudoflavonifractor sp. 524-17]